MAMYAKVRRLYYREKLSLSEIARQTSLSRNTVKKWVKSPEGEEPKYERAPVTGLLTPYVSHIQLALQVDAHRPKRDRRTKLALFKEIKNIGYTGSYSVTVQRHHL